MSELDLNELTRWAKAAPDSGVLLHVSDALALIAAARENTRLRAELSAACGYLLNAKIDLETGAPPFPPTETIMDDQRKVTLNDIETLELENARLQSRLDAIEGRMAEAREAVRLADIVLPVKSDADGSVDGTCVPADSWCAAAIVAALNLLHEEETDG